MDVTPIALGPGPRAPGHRATLPGLLALRRLVDLLAAGVLLVLALPLLLGSALAVLLFSGKPIFFGHPRVGWRGRTFRCWKFRTMHLDAERRLHEEPGLRRRYIENGYKLNLDIDPRITTVGRWLRRTYLDELPQLVNVLNGSMSLVGPRPVVEEELEEFGSDAPELLSIRPGIVGEWTSLGAGRPGYPDRAWMELEYVRTRSIRGDLSVIFRSLPVILKGARVAEGEAGGRASFRRKQRIDPEEGHPSDAEGLRRVLANALNLLFAYLLPRLATFAAVVVAARVLGVVALGAYGTAAALAVILSITSTLGMMQLLVRELAQAPQQAPRLMGAANATKTGSGLLMLGTLAVLAIWVLKYPPQVVAATLFLGISYAIGSYGENLGAFFQSIERMDVWMKAQAAFGLLSGSLGIALALTTGSIVWFCLAPVVGQLGSLSWLLFQAPASVRKAWGASWMDIRRLLEGLFPFAAAFIALTAYYKIDILLVEGWRGTGEAGFYAAAYKFVDIAQALALVLATAIYPRLARLAAGTSAGPPTAGDVSIHRISPYQWAATRALELLALTAIPAAGLLWLLREPIVMLLFGDGFQASVPVLALLAPVLPVLALNALGTFILAAARRMGPVVGLYAGGLILNLGLNAILIPPFGARGAALAMLVSESVLAGGMLAVLYRYTATSPGRRARNAAMAAALAAGLVAWPGLPSVAEGAGYLIAVALLYWLARVVPASEISMLRRAIQP